MSIDLNSSKSYREYMAGIDKYPALVGFLKEIGHYQEGSPPKYLAEGPADPRAVVGMEFYRLLSSKSPEEVKIFYNAIVRQRAEKADISNGLSAQDVEDILREDVVLRILECHPVNFIDAYKRDDGHIRLDDFSNCFNGAGSNYSEWIKDLKEITPTRELVYQDERTRVLHALNRNTDKIKKLINLLKSEKDPLPELGRTIEKNLQELLTPENSSNE